MRGYLVSSGRFSETDKHPHPFLKVFSSSSFIECLLYPEAMRVPLLCGVSLRLPLGLVRKLQVLPVLPNEESS